MSQKCFTLKGNRGLDIDLPDVSDQDQQFLKMSGELMPQFKEHQQKNGKKGGQDLEISI